MTWNHLSDCPPRVLVVDEDAVIRMALERAVRLEGFAVAALAQIAGTVTPARAVRSPREPLLRTPTSG